VAAKYGNEIALLEYQTNQQTINEESSSTSDGFASPTM
jgi:hypothetical protein